MIARLCLVVTFMIVPESIEGSTVGTAQLAGCYHVLSVREHDKDRVEAHRQRRVSAPRSRGSAPAAGRRSARCVVGLSSRGARGVAESEAGYRGHAPDLAPPCIAGRAECPPPGDPDRLEEGVFSTRSPHRPNPIGLHRVEIVAIDGLRVRVRSLEALNGTPILDVKPILSEDIRLR